MGYITIAEMQTLFGNEEVLIAADRDGNGIQEDPAIQAAIDYRSSFADTYLKAGGYVIPVNPVPYVLKLCVGECSLYELSLASGVNTVEKRKRFEDWLRWLEAVGKGDAALDAPKNEGPNGGPFLRYSSEKRIFTRDKAAIF